MVKPPLNLVTHPCPRPPYAVVFDLDGTLVDSGPVIVASYNAGLKATGHRPLPAHHILMMLGPPLDELYGRRIPADQVPPACAAYRAEFERLFRAHVRAAPGAVELLEELRAAGVKTAICTNRARHTTEILDQCGLSGLVDAVVQLTDGPYTPKPDPDMLYATMDKLDAIPAETCYVGDSIADMGAGKAAQVWTIGILSLELDPAALEGAGAHVVAVDLLALPRVLGLRPEPEPVAVPEPAVPADVDVATAEATPAEPAAGDESPPATEASAPPVEDTAPPPESPPVEDTAPPSPSVAPVTEPAAAGPTGEAALGAPAPSAFETAAPPPVAPPPAMPEPPVESVHAVPSFATPASEERDAAVDGPESSGEAPSPLAPQTPAEPAPPDA